MTRNKALTCRPFSTRLTLKVRDRVLLYRTTRLLIIESINQLAVEDGKELARAYLSAEPG
jgi:hypothetical protein